jgi:hypothetical protein
MRFCHVGYNTVKGIHIMKNLFVISCLLLSFTTAAHALTASVEGIYKTDFNDMLLSLDGNTVTGTYKFKGGKVSGTLQGHTLTGIWVQTNAKGKLEFVFNKDFSAFTGKWGYNDAVPSKKWNGKKIKTAFPEKVASAKVADNKADSTPKVMEPENKKQPEPKAVSKSGDAQPYLQPGQSAEYKDLEIALLSLTQTDNYINGPKKDCVYAVLRFRVKNMGKEEASARIYGDLQWKHPQTGMRDGYQRTTGVKLNNPEKYELAPGAQGEFEEVYMFPSHLKEAEFHLLKGYNPKELARWMLPIR